MKRSAVLPLALLAFWAVATVQADIIDDIYRGFQIYSTPLGSPLINAGDGTLVNGARAGRLRIVPSGIGGGYELQMDRTFGSDSRGRPEVYHFAGLADLQLSGQTQFTAGYNGKEFRTVRANFATSNLNYSFRSLTGAQDVGLSGTLTANGAIEINPLGFYTLALTANNTNSQFQLNGVAVQDTQPTNFNVGPITLRGNIYADGLASLIAANGGDTSALAHLFPQSGIAALTSSIQTGAQAAQSSVVAGDTATRQQADLSTLLVRAVLGQDQQATSELLQGLADGTLQNANAVSDSSGQSSYAIVPEPGALVVMLLGAVVLRLRRTR